jgi:RNA polymerase sigma-70 factor (ECF subfamily)
MNLPESSQPPSIRLARLIDGLRNRNVQALEEVYDRYQRRIRAFAARRLDDPVEVEDVVHETFARAFEDIVAYRESTPFSSWLLSISRKFLYEREREELTTNLPFDPEEVPDMNSQDGSPERRLDAARTLDRCDQILQRFRDPSNREIFYLHYRDCRQIRSIAGKLGKSTTAVKVSLHRSRGVLQRVIPNLGREEAERNGKGEKSHEASLP